MFYLMALFIVLIMVVGILPVYVIKHNPEPSAIPELHMVAGIPPGTINKTNDSRNFNRYVEPNNPLVKQAATFIATYGCGPEKICQLKAQYYFVRDRFVYVSEHDEYIQSPAEMLYTGGGDCDDHAVLLASLVQSIGIPTRFVLTRNHIYVLAYMPDAPRRYRDSDGWIPLDATCKSCRFAEIRLP